MSQTPLTEIWYENAGTKLFAVESGSGPPVVLLHGGLANHVSTQLIAPAGCRVITPDLRGSARSIYAGKLTWQQLADDVAALVWHCGLERAVIGGISFGTGAAIATALSYPQVVEALVLLHPVYAGTEVGLTSAQQAAMNAMDVAGTRTLTEGVQALFPLLDTLPEALRARARATFETYDPASVAASTHFMASGQQPFATAAELTRVSAATLLVPGIDPYHPREVSDLYARHVPRCKLREVEPDHFGSAIEDFIHRGFDTK